MAYNYNHCDLEEVAGNIDEYIIPECQDACKVLWAHNIFTFMCSDIPGGKEGDIKTEPYIWVALGKLSEENQRILDRLCKEDPEHYKGNKICIDRSAENLGEQLAALADAFEMQDVIEEGEGCQTVENFLARCHGLSRADDLIEPKREDFESDIEFELAKANWEAFTSNETPPELILDDRSLEECLEDEGLTYLYDEENGIVYLSPFYMAMHQRYLDYVQGKEPEPIEATIEREARLLVRGNGEEKEEPVRDTSVRDKIAEMREKMASSSDEFVFEGNEQEGEEVLSDDGIIVNPGVRETTEEENLRLEIENLRQENEQLREAHSAIIDENTRLREENLELQGMFLRVREFMTKRLARIPFIGKRIIKEMEEELGEKQLPEGRDKHSGDSR